MDEAREEPWEPFGRGWTTAGTAAVTMLVLILARRYGAGAYGFGAVPFLLVYFVVTGVVAGRAVASMLRPLWRPLVVILAVAVAGGTVYAAGYFFNGRESGEPLLGPLFGFIVVPAVVWAAFAPGRARNGACATAAVATAGFLVARAADL